MTLRTGADEGPGQGKWEYQLEIPCLGNSSERTITTTQTDEYKTRTDEYKTSKVRQNRSYAPPDHGGVVFPLATPDSSVASVLPPGPPRRVRYEAWTAQPSRHFNAALQRTSGSSTPMASASGRSKAIASTASPSGTSTIASSAGTTSAPRLRCRPGTRNTQPFLACQPGCYARHSRGRHARF